MIRIKVLTAPISLLIASVLAFAVAPTPGPIGRKVSLPDTTGRLTSIPVSGKKATVVFVLSTQCPITNRYTPRIQRLWKDYSPKGVGFVAVYPNASDTNAMVRTSARSRGYAFQVVRDTGGRLVRQWGVKVTPEAVVLDRQGNVVYRGSIDDNPDVKRVRQRLVASAVDDLLAGKKVRTARHEAVGCLIEASAPMKTASITYTGGVQAILRENCEPCHHDGGSAPFTLATFQQARAWAPMIRQVTQKRVMPPWKPAPDFGHFRGERRLTDAQIRTLARWVEAGAPSGDLRQARPPQKWVQGWKLGQPEMLLQPDRPYHLAAEGDDVYRCYSFAVPGTEVRWLKGVEVRLGNRAVVHHVLLFLDPNGKSAELDGRETDPGYTSSGGGINVDNADILGGWAPGIEPNFLPPGTAFAIPPGARLVVQVHYHKNGLPETDRTSVGLHWEKGVVNQTMHMIPILNPEMRLPAGQKGIPVHAEMELPADAHVYSVTPHMHLLGRSMQAVATRPDGTRVPLIKIPNWDFNWQAIYELREPIALPAGTKINVDAVYDNSADNPLNPNRPPREVRWGEQTTDEMCLFFLGTTFDGERNASLQAAARASSTR